MEVLYLAFMLNLKHSIIELMKMPLRMPSLYTGMPMRSTLMDKFHTT